MITDNITIIGNDHVQKGIECQDNSVSWKGDGYAAAIVCDGHGGPKYIRSKIGSEIACRVGKEMVEEFMEGLRGNWPLSDGKAQFLIGKESSEKQLSQLERAIILRWNEGVNAHLAENPIEEDPRFGSLPKDFRVSLRSVGEKAYGTTFILTVLTTQFCFVLKLGDGNVVMASDGKVFSPEEFSCNGWDFDLTVSLCDSDADMVFCNCFIDCSETAVDGVIVMTDGIIKCYDNMDSYYRLVANMFAAYIEDPLEVAHNELEGALTGFSRRGSGDDMSIGIVCKEDAKLPEVFDEAPEKMVKDVTAAAEPEDSEAGEITFAQALEIVAEKYFKEWAGDDPKKLQSIEDLKSSGHRGVQFFDATDSEENE